MTAIDRVRQIIEPTLMAKGFDLVRVQLTGGERRPTLQVMAERQDHAAMTVEDCAEISRAVSALLDVEDPIPTAYTLEVSSPGIDRPLTRIGDFERFRGFEAKIESRAPISGRKRFRGRIEKVEGDQVVLRLTDGAPEMAAIPFDGIAKAKLVLTDDLIEATGGRG